MYTTKLSLRTFTVRDSHPINRRLRAHCSKDAARIARTILGTMDADKEHFVVLCFNNKNRLEGFKHISTGSMTASLVHPREVFTAALELRAAALIFVHNHPSGDPTPSIEDREVTRRLKEVADLMGIRILDHIILGDLRSFFSMNDRGLL